MPYCIADKNYNLLPSSEQLVVEARQIMFLLGQLWEMMVALIRVHVLS